VLAYVWDVKSRDKASPDDLEKTIDERPNNHNMLVYNKKQTPAVISNRDFLGRAIWKKAEGGGFLFVTTPEESEKRSTSVDVVRATFPSIMRITPSKNGNETKLEYAIHPDFGGAVQSRFAWILLRYMRSNLGRVTAIQEYFIQIRELRDYDKADGRALGYRRECPRPSRASEASANES
jgi:hypothetical protein